MFSRAESFLETEREIGANIAQLDKLAQRLSKQSAVSYIRDYANAPPLSAYFMSLPIPAWIKKVDESYKKPRFVTMNTNYCFMDAYGIRPEEAPWAQADHWTNEEVDSMNASDIEALRASGPVKHQNYVMNYFAGQKENITTIKWRIRYGTHVAIAGCVVDPSYVDKLIKRLHGVTKPGDYSKLSDAQLIAQMERASEQISRARVNLVANTELLRQFFIESPIPMWQKQVVRRTKKSEPEFHLTQVSKGVHELEEKTAGRKVFNINDTKSDVAVAKSLSVVENGKILLPGNVEGRKKSATRSLHWPIVSNGELSMSAGVLIGLN